MWTVLKKLFPLHHTSMLKSCTSHIVCLCRWEDASIVSDPHFSLYVCFDRCEIIFFLMSQHRLMNMPCEISFYFSSSCLNILFPGSAPTKTNAMASLIGQHLRKWVICRTTKRVNVRNLDFHETMTYFYRVRKLLVFPMK